MSTDKNGKDNHYKDYLPQNRYKKDILTEEKEKNNILFSSKILKKGLYIFYGAVFIVVIGVVLRFNGYNILEVDERSYNMNLAETIDLDSVYKGKDVEWVSNSKNVVVKNNVVTALKSGKAYLYAKVGNRQVKDINVDVLESGKGMSILNHSISLSLGLSGKIKVSKGKEFINNTRKGFFSFTYNQWINYKKWVSNVFGGHRETDIIDTDEWLKGNNDNWGSVDSVNETKSNTNVINNENNTKIDNNIDNNIDNSNITNIEDDSNDDVDVANENNINDADNKSNLTDDEEDYVEGYTTVDYGDYSSEGLTYYSTNEDIAVVDEEGNIDPISPGVVSIVVEDKYGNRDHSVVTIKEDSLNMVRNDYVFNVGDKAEIKYYLDSKIYKNEDIKWSVDNSSVVKVSDKGVVESVAEGNAVVLAKVGNMEEKVNIEVSTSKQLPTNLALSSVEEDIIVGDSFEIGSSISYKEEDRVDDEEDDEDVGVVEEDGNTIEDDENTIGEDDDSIDDDEYDEDSYDEDEEDESSLQMSSNTQKKAKSLLLAGSGIEELACISSDERTVIVGNDGIAVAKGAGTAVITCTTSNGISKSVEVTTVTQSIPVQDITVENRDITIDVDGEPYKLDYKLVPDDTTERDVQISYDRTYLDIDTSNGSIIGKKVGKTVLEIKTKNEKTVKINVTINSKKITDLKLDFSSLTLGIGENRNLSLMYYPADGTLGTGVTWTTSNANVATVDATGKVTAKAKGTATIMAVVTYSDGTKFTASCEIVVINKMGNVGAGITSIDFTDSLVNAKDSSGYIHVYQGKTFDIKAHLKNSTVRSGATYSLSSGDKGIVSLDTKTGVFKVNRNINGHKAEVTVSYGSLKTIVKFYTNANKSPLKLEKVLDVSTSTSSTFGEGTKKFTQDITAAQMFCIAGKDRNYYVFAKRNADGSDSCDGDKHKQNGINQCTETRVTVYVFKSSSTSKAKYYFSKTGKKDSNNYYVEKSSFSHANDCTSKGNEIFVSTNNSANKAIKKFSINSTASGEISGSSTNVPVTDDKFGVPNSGISYDYYSKTDRWYLASGMKIFVFDGKSKINTITKAFDTSENGAWNGKIQWQGIGSYKGVVFMLRNMPKYGNKPDYSAGVAKWKYAKNSIDYYRASDGKFLGSIVIPFGGDSPEVEAIDVKETGDKNIVDAYIFVNNNPDGKTDRLYKARMYVPS